MGPTLRGIDSRQSCQSELTERETRRARERNRQSMNCHSAASYLVNGIPMCRRHAGAAVLDAMATGKVAANIVMQMEVGRYHVGDQVEKFTGDYQLNGEVRAVLTTKAGKLRYVVEHDPGFLHIYSDANLRPVSV